MHEHFDVQKAFEHIAALSRMRRLAGTPGEIEARAYIHEVGKDTGVAFQDEEFSYSTAPLKLALPATCLAIGAISAAGSLAYLMSTRLVIVLGVALLAVIYLGFKWSGAFEKFASKGSGRSSNIVGKIEGAEPTGAVLISAHYDSKSQLMPVALRASLFMLGFATAILLGLFLVTTGILATTGHSSLGSRVVFYVSLLPSLLMFALIFNATGNRSPGAMDNASGVAVILEVARVIAERPLERFDLIVAAFGAEEFGLCGSISYLLAHEEELRRRPFYMLNFDMPFSRSGNLMVNTGFELPPVRTSKMLNGLVRSVGKRMGLRVRGVYMPIGAAADHVPWVKHGFEATGLTCAMTRIHSTGDSIDRVNREGMRRVGEATIAILRELDQKNATQGSSPGVAF